MEQKFSSVSSSPKDIYNFHYHQYWEELRKFNLSETKTFPLHLYSFRVYLAHINLWKIINRNKLTLKEIEIMNELGCYRLSRTELGIPRYRSKGVQI